VLTSEETLARLSGGTLDIGLVALPQAAVDGLSVKPWRRDPVMAFVPAGWDAPRTVTPQWLAAQPLILNAPNTRLSRLTAEWFTAAGEHPAARIQLNFNDAVKSLVAAGYGATLLPHEVGQQEMGVPPADHWYESGPSPSGSTRWLVSAVSRWPIAGRPVIPTVPVGESLTACSVTLNEAAGDQPKPSFAVTANERVLPSTIASDMLL